VPEPRPPKTCGWPDGCPAVLPDRRASFCPGHRADGTALLRSQRNARYNEAQRALAAHALAPDLMEDGAVLLPRPLADRLAGARERLARAVAEHDRCTRVFVGWQVNQDREGWAGLKREHEQRLRFAVIELRGAAKEMTDALGTALPGTGGAGGR